MTDRLNLSAGLLLFTVAVLGAQQPDRAGTEALASRAATRLQALQAEADRLASAERTLLGDLRKLELDRDIAAEQVRQAADRSETAVRDRTAVDEQVQRLEAEQRSDAPELGRRLVALYKLGGARYLRLLLSTPDLRRIGEASRMVAALAARDQHRVAAYQQRLTELKTSRATLAAREAELTSLRTEAERAQAAVDRALAARTDLVRRIDGERDLNAQLTGELQAAQQKLQTTLRDLGGGAAAARSPATLPLAPFQGDLDWPVGGTLRLRFDQTAVGRGGRSNGIEIAAPEGTAVTAVHDGTVAFADTFTGFGQLVILDHGGQNYSLYGDLTTLAVSQGARVAKGDQVGSVGSPATAGPGLYFELRIDGKAVDPLQWLKKR